jgi:hypothetical protein
MPSGRRRPAPSAEAVGQPVKVPTPSVTSSDTSQRYRSGQVGFFQPVSYNMFAQHRHELTCEHSDVRLPRAYCGMESKGSLARHKPDRAQRFGLSQASISARESRAGVRSSSSLGS